MHTNTNVARCVRDCIHVCVHTAQVIAVEKAAKLRQEFTDFLFSIYDTYRDSDVRLLQVFLKKMLIAHSTSGNVHIHVYVVCICLCVFV